MIDYLLKEYPFVGGILPELKIGEPPEITFPQLDFILKMNLTDGDYDQALIFRRYTDFQNIRRFINKEELDPHGILNEKEIEEALLTRSGFPAYLFDFLDKYENDHERLKHVAELQSIHYQQEILEAKGFVKEYMIFERDWRRIFCVLRAKKMGRDIAEELKYENPNDGLMQLILEQKDLNTFDPPDEYIDLKEIFEKYAESPMDLHRALYEYRFHKITQMCGLEVFTLKRILGYMIQLILVEKWNELNQLKGIEFIDNLIKGAK